MKQREIRSGFHSIRIKKVFQHQRVGFEAGALADDHPGRADIPERLEPSVKIEIGFPEVEVLDFAPFAVQDAGDVNVHIAESPLAQLFLDFSQDAVEMAIGTITSLSGVDMGEIEAG